MLQVWCTEFTVNKCVIHVSQYNCGDRSNCDVVSLKFANSNTRHNLSPNDPGHVHDHTLIGDPETHETEVHMHLSTACTLSIGMRQIKLRKRRGTMNR
jgi:hypothetical protein